MKKIRALIKKDSLSMQFEMKTEILQLNNKNITDIIKYSMSFLTKVSEKNDKIYKCVENYKYVQKG